MMFLPMLPLNDTDAALPEPLIQRPSELESHVHAYQSSVPVLVAEAFSVTPVEGGVVGFTVVGTGVVGFAVVG